MRCRVTCFADRCRRPTAQIAVRDLCRTGTELAIAVHGAQRRGLNGIIFLTAFFEPCECNRMHAARD